MSRAMEQHSNDPSPCKRCGDIHDPKRCDGHRREDGKQCRKPKGWGIPGVRHGNCKHHGGATPNGRKHAEQLELHTRIAATLERYEMQPGADDPLAQLISALRTAGAMRRIFAELVGTLGGGATAAYVERGEGEAAPNYVPAEPAGIVGPDHKGDGKPHVYVVELRVWTTETARIAKLALDAGIDERRVRIAESQARWAADVIRGAAVDIIDAFVRHGAAAEVVALVRGELGGLLRRRIEAMEMPEVLEGRVLDDA